MSIVQMMRTADILSDYRDGDEHGWDVEFEWLDTHHSERLYRLAEDVAANGIRTPITLGHDGRVWDGHHRLYVAQNLGIDSLPVVHAGGEAP